MSYVPSCDGGVFIVYGYGGTGKTFIWKSLSAEIRSKGDIVLNVAFSGIASLLLPCGRTAHTRFKIHINVNEVSCAIFNKSTERHSLDSDRVLNSDGTSYGFVEIHFVEFLNNLKCSGTSNHPLLLKVGTRDVIEKM
ncbi:uncharacterized protein LOC121809024 [Salvia splendens]|uniref:uncharacterized protein LOC121809024 n=1 Tax=Salvia splendens TaxID=180675 RepID=UPI001C25A4DB|nr:uncharacterized protein LOC121809024 [Salvia splendens]